MPIKFNLKETSIFFAVKQERLPIFKFADFFKKLFLILFVLSLFFIGLSLIGSLSLSLAIRMSVFCLTFSVIFWEINFFFIKKIKNPPIEKDISNTTVILEDYNIAELLSFESAQIVNLAINFCKRRKISEVSSEALLYAALTVNKHITYIFSRLGLDFSSVQDNLKNHLEKSEKEEILTESFSPDFYKTIEEALKVAITRKHKRIEARDLLIGISKEDFFKGILVENSLKIEDFENLTLWFDYLERKIEESKNFWAPENLAMYGSMGKDWAAGYTITLDQYSIDMRRSVRSWMYKAIIGHEKEIELIQQAICRPEVNNALIVGDPGTGRESIIEGLARRVFLGKSLPELNYARVVELDMTSLLSQIKSSEEVESTIDRIFQEVITAGNVILVVKEFQNYIGLDVAQPGMVDISGIIGKYLKFKEFKFIAMTDYAGLHTRIEKNPSLLSLFEKIEVSEISEEETIRILLNLTLELEARYKVFVTYPAIRELVSLAARYIPNKPFPQKAIDLLQDVVVYVARSLKQTLILPEHVSKVVSTKTEIPVGKVEFKEKETLLNLEKLIHARIINQEESVKEISIAMRRARSGIGSKKRPMGSFLFLGPTGVGKTETSKALAEIYFGGEDKMIRLDMSEFQSIKDIPRLLGSRGEEGLLITPVRENPFALILIDEIEKAHKNILNLFLQILDEGNITDGQGRKVVFTNTIIICTSNAGAEMIFKATEENKPVNKDKLLESLFKKAIFRPEFINRFDGVVLFKPLSKQNLMDICQLSMKSLQKNMKEKDIDFIITEPLKEKIVGLSYKPAFGAREMRRVIQDNVENVIAQALLSDNIKKGESFEVSPDFTIKKVEPKS